MPPDRLDRTGISSERVLALDAGDRVRVAGFERTAVASAHERLDRGEQGRCLYLGYVVRCGETAVYHAGDTVRYESLAESLIPHRIGVALLPINGRPGNVPGNLTAVEAVALARDIGARLLIPCHFDMFEFNTADPAECQAEAARQGVPCLVLRPGESWRGREDRDPAMLPAPVAL
jgi:L-ascorbate metabolism protein UlaG (beta-lactamase superfamily)